MILRSNQTNFKQFKNRIFQIIKYKSLTFIQIPNHQISQQKDRNMIQIFNKSNNQI